MMEKGDDAQKTVSSQRAAFSAPGRRPAAAKLANAALFFGLASAAGFFFSILGGIYLEEMGVISFLGPLVFLPGSVAVVCAVLVLRGGEGEASREEKDLKIACEPGQEPVQEPGRDTSSHAGQEPGHHTSSEPGQELEQVPGRDTSSEPGQGSEQEPGYDTSSHAGQEPEQVPSLDFDHHPGCEEGGGALARERGLFYRRRALVGLLVGTVTMAGTILTVLFVALFLTLTLLGS